MILIRLISSEDAWLCFSGITFNIEKTVEQFAEADRLTRVTFFAVKKQIPVPRYGGLAPPFYLFQGLEKHMNVFQIVTLLERPSTYFKD